LLSGKAVLKQHPINPKPGGCAMKHAVKLLALFFIIGLAGCASNSDVDAVKALAQQANATAEAALKSANEANGTAQDAKIIAQDANATAQDAKATSAATETKIDRMFKKAMYK
jgi:hypothetical protein